MPSPASELEATPTPPAENSITVTPKNGDPIDVDMELGDNADEETRLQFLTAGVRDQIELERVIGRQADQLLTEQADERDKKRMDKAEAEIKRTEAAIAKLRTRLTVPAVQSVKIKIRGEIAEKQQKIDGLVEELDSIQQRINDRHKGQFTDEDSSQDEINRPLPNESRRDFLIRTGKITPFSKLTQEGPASSTLGEVMLDTEVEDIYAEALKEQGPTSHRNLMKPGFGDEPSSSEAPSPPSVSRTLKKRRIATTGHAVSSKDSSAESESPSAESDDAFVPDMTDRELAALGESEGASEESTDDYEGDSSSRKHKFAGSKTARKKVKAQKTAEHQEDLAGMDDGDETVYQARIASWTTARATARKRVRERQGVDTADNEAEECYNPHPTQPDGIFDGGLRIPGDIFSALFDYQKTGVKWLWELYSQNVGGIVGDEMGLGKTIQSVGFIAGLHYSKKLTKPVIVVCPATVMVQWVREFHRWWPALRVSILHTSGSGMLDTRREARLERNMEMWNFGENKRSLTKMGKAAKRIVEKVKREGHVLVTTYSGLQSYAEFLIPTEWECAILDEGHRIRNPNTSITIHCKELRTPNRIILSGTPMQNNLTELWSLFDFVFPMRLGTLVNFRNQFEFPIKRGGYANASNLEFETAMRCAETLKDAVSPYLLQRFKADVAADLPEKKEQVLFCKLTRQQREAYEKFLNSEDMKSISDGKRRMLFGVDYLRKICNHPDLTEHKTLSTKKGYNYGAGHKSGKMQVVKELLSIWKKGGHRTLLFAQHRIMLDILENFIKNMPGFNYRRMDGLTRVEKRDQLVAEFNHDPDIHVFLLTTKVGGQGVNLTGADRLIIYDPDWNPSTDIQARERSYRLGQTRAVEIYRLMSAGTIEEKIYHRQIFKQFLTNSILKDPKQRQTFQMSDLHDLFTLGADRANGETETATLFRDSEIKFKDKHKASGTWIPTPRSKSPKRKGKQPAQDNTAPEDLAAVRGIHHAEAFVDPDEEDDDKNGTAPSEDGVKDRSDTALMSAIFEKSGVQSVVEHDAIVNSTGPGKKRKVQADPKFIQREARRAAAEAAEQLRRAEQEARQLPAGVPTWTGTYGEAGRPQERPRGGMSSRGGRGGSARSGPSSTAILSNLADRQGRSTSARSLASSGTSTSTTLRGRRMLEMLRDFMVTHGGVVPTRMLIDHFDRYCRAVRGRGDEFKEMLKLIADYEHGSAGRGKWILKEEWRNSTSAYARR